jgi:hypothetical protein
MNNGDIISIMPFSNTKQYKFESYTDSGGPVANYASISIIECDNDA